MRHRNACLNAFIVALLVHLALYVGIASAQVAPTFVADFNGSVASSPYIGGGIIKGSDGAFYGLTYDSINTRCGTVYKVLGDGTLTVLHEFQGHAGTPPDGCQPMGELVEGADGNLWGTTRGGGANADATFTAGTGTIFKISKNGATYSLVHSFLPYDASLTYWPEGAAPVGGLTIGWDGNFYGTTGFSGSTTNGNCTSLGGTVYRLSPSDPSGTPTIIHAFLFAEGCSPTNLTLASDGSFIGTTIQGGDDGVNSLGGTIFRVTPAGTFTRLAVLPGTIASGTPYGYGPYSAPIETGDGTLYGTTTSGGPANGGNEAGTVYKCVPSGAACDLALVHAFTGADGGNPFAGLTMGADGNLYGTTPAGGDFTNGVLFRVSAGDAFENLYSFNQSNTTFSGSNSYARLLEATPGTFYGTTLSGGSLSGPGSIFRFTVASATTTGLQVSPAATVFGQSVTFTASVSSTTGAPTGNVEFFDGTTSLRTSTLNGGVAILSTAALSVGGHAQLSAKYLGDGSFLTSTSSNASVTVNPAQTAMVLGSSPNPSSRKQTVTLTATVSAVAPGGGTATGQVQFLDGKKKLGTAALVNGVATLQVSFNGMGSHDLTATYGGDGNFVGSVSPALTQRVSR